MRIATLASGASYERPRRCVKAAQSWSRRAAELIGGQRSADDDAGGARPMAGGSSGRAWRHCRAPAGCSRGRRAGRGCGHGSCRGRRSRPERTPNAASAHCRICANSACASAPSGGRSRAACGSPTRAVETLQTASTLPSTISVMRCAAMLTRATTSAEAGATRTAPRGKLMETGDAIRHGSMTVAPASVGPRPTSAIVP